MMTFLQGMDNCEEIRQASMDIFPGGMPAGMRERDHAFGEDQYLRRCLVHLNVKMVNEFDSLLSEKFACVERPKDCGGTKVAFHAYKTTSDWMKCRDFSSSQGGWPASLS